MSGVGEQLVADPGMRALFKSELSSHTAKLSACLGQQGGHAAPTDEMIAAMQALAGAARIVKVEPVSTLAAAVGSLLASRRDAGRWLAAEDVALLQEVVEALQDVGSSMTLEARAMLDLATRLEAQQTAVEPEVQQLPEDSLFATEDVCAAPADDDASFLVERPASVSVSIFSLFKAEVESHARDLADRLLALEKSPGDAELLDALMRAAHSVKGAARIIKLDPVVDLAHQMEDVFVAAQRGHRALDAADVDLLLECTDLLVEVGRESVGWVGPETVDRIRALVEALNRLEAPPTEDSGSIFADRPSTADAGADEPAPVHLAGSSVLERPASVSVSILALFKTEVVAHARSLVDGLLSLEQRPDDPELLDSLMRAAHSIKGAARITKLDAVVSLAHHMEDIFVSAKDHKQAIDHGGIDLLLRCVDAVAAVGQDPGDWIQPRDVEHLEELTGALEVLAAGGAPAVTPAELRQQPAEPPSAVQAEPVDEGAVKVAAAHLNTLMDLTAEAVVRGRALVALGQAQRNLQQQLHEVAGTVDALSQEVDDDKQGTIAQLRRGLRSAQAELRSHMAELNDFSTEYGKLSERTHQEVISTKMRPFADVVQGFPRMVRDICRRTGKRANLSVAGHQVKVDRDILSKVEAPLTHLIRNALDHGLEHPEERRRVGKPELGQVRVNAYHHQGMLLITVSDDGRGIDLESIRRKVVDRQLVAAGMADKLSEEELHTFMFLPGFTTSEEITDLSGRGVGLDVVQTMVHGVGGEVDLSSVLGRGTEVRLRLPVTLSVIRGLLVEIGSEPCAFRLSRIDRCLTLARDQVIVDGAREFIAWDGEQVPVVDACHLLGRPTGGRSRTTLSIVLLRDREQSLGVVVDRFLGEHELVVRPLDPRLGKVQSVAAVATMGTGELVLLLDVEDLVNVVRAAVTTGRLRARSEPHRAWGPQKRVLVVDDSITVREEERNILEEHGFHVDTAVDGMDAWGALSLASYDLVVTDVDMPRLNGLELIRRIRESGKHADLPVVIVSYKDRAEDQRLGLEAGANYYFTKSAFEDDTLIEAVKRLLVTGDES